MNTVIAFILTMAAGVSTGIGSAIAFKAKRTNRLFLSSALGFSAGVMLFVSFAEIFPKAMRMFSSGNEAYDFTAVSAAFMCGMLITALIDKLVPEKENPHEIRYVEQMHKTPSEDKLMKAGIVTAVAIAIHNFPEGIATFTSALYDPQLGASVAFAIAIHNIPEGIAVAVPIFYATGSRKKAFWLSFASGLAEPAGALLAYVVLMRYLNSSINALLFAAVGGIMVFISLDELLPSAREYGHHHAAMYWMMAGMAVMAGSLILFKI